MEDNQQIITLAPQEAQEYDEFKRQKRVAEARAVIHKIELDYTQIQAERTSLRRMVNDAQKAGLGGICVKPYLVKPCREYAGVSSTIAVVACLSCDGADVTDIKVKQIKRAVKDGADIVEVTVNISAVKEGSWGYIKREFKKLCKAAKKATLRINVEAPLLTSQELTKLCTLLCDCKIPCICTASGSYGGGADEEDIKVIKTAIKDRAGIKANGVDSAGGLSALSDYGVIAAGSASALTLAMGILKEAER